MIVPLVIAAAISYWPQAAPEPLSSIAVLPAQVHGFPDEAELAGALPAALSNHLTGIDPLKLEVQPERADILVLSAITSDSGLVQLNIRAINRRTRQEIWSNVYQAPRAQYTEMLQAAGETLRLELIRRAAATHK